MLIPHNEYKTWASPAKIDIKNFTPRGPLWDKYNCSFQDVIKEGV